MSDSTPFPPAFSFSTSSSSLGNGEFTFSAGINNQSTDERRRPIHVRKRPTATAAHNTTAPSSSFVKCPPIFAERANEKDSAKESTHENGMPENAKTRFTVLSALTGMVPCSFEGSSYSSLPIGRPSCFATGTEKSIKKEERDEKSAQNPSALSSQITVSRTLKGIPQNPHFWPLRRYSEPAKQSLIKAWDQIFEETVVKIQSVQINGFYIDAKRVWETIQELQMMGYNVIPLRRRLVELSDVMQRKKRHGSEKMRLKKKGEEHLMEKNRLEFEILKLKAKVEAEKASFEDVMAKVAKMEDEMPSFNGFFSKLAIEPL